MSYEHNRFALAAARQLSTRAAHVLLALAVRTDDDGRCHPSITRIAQDTRRHRNTVIAAIAELEAAGMLAVERNSRRVNRYTLPTSTQASTIRSTVGTTTEPTSTHPSTSTGTQASTPTTPELPIELRHDAAALRPGDVVRCPRRPTRSGDWCTPTCPLCHGMHHVYAEQLGVS